MRNTDTFRQYIWLINTIERHKKINLETLSKSWTDYDLNNGKPLARTTFYRLKQAIEDMFGIQIECDAKDGYKYYIANSESLKNNSTQNWMLRTLTVNSVLLDGLMIKDQLLLEEIPAGIEYLQTIISAMKCHHTLNMGYKKFNDAEGYTILVEPYCLKVFRQRWYMLGKIVSKGNQFHIYALDRITHLYDTDKSYDLDSDFNAEVFFRNFFGVFIGDDKPQRIVLRAHNKMVNFLRTLPLHHSQKEILETEEYSDFELFLVPTWDFCQAILKEGDELEVISPLSLREQIVKILKSALKNYQ